ncbi:hypothetical protein D3C72_2420080 [compost metagenome]
MDTDDLFFTGFTQANRLQYAGTNHVDRVETVALAKQKIVLFQCPDVFDHVIEYVDFFRTR